MTSRNYLKLAARQVGVEGLRTTDEALRCPTALLRVGLLGGLCNFWGWPADLIGLACVLRRRRCRFSKSSGVGLLKPEFLRCLGEGAAVTWCESLLFGSARYFGLLPAWSPEE